MCGDTTHTDISEENAEEARPICIDIHKAQIVYIVDSIRQRVHFP